MRAAPRPLTGVLVFLGYLVVFYAVWIITGVDYETIGDSASNILKWYVAPLVAGAIYLVIAVTALGWWRPAIFEVAKAKPRWLLIGPIIMALFAVLAIVVTDKSNTTAQMALLILVGSVLVGFCEELATRGVLIVGFRSKYTEPMVWFLSSLLFGLLHLPNWVFGVGPVAVFQVFLAFASGTMLYLTRRVTGSLVFAMALHGLWDFSTFIGKLPPSASALAAVNGLLALVLVFILLRRERGKRIAQAGVAQPAALVAA